MYNAILTVCVLLFFIKQLNKVNFTCGLSNFYCSNVFTVI